MVLYCFIGGQTVMGERSQHCKTYGCCTCGLMGYVLFILVGDMHDIASFPGFAVC